MINVNGKTVKAGSQFSLRDVEVIINNLSDISLFKNIFFIKGCYCPSGFGRS
jgi:hypothetical protein